MIERDKNPRYGPAGDGSPRNQEPSRTGPVQEPKHNSWWKLWLILKTIQARLRFVFILVAIGGLIAYWDTFSAYYEKWTRAAAEEPPASSEFEWFCPMHLYIVRDNPKEKCPICFMDLAKRKKGTGQAEPLPPGTVSRVQLSPYRIVLAGVQTWEMQYQPLAKELTTFGSVEFDETRQAHIATRQKGRIETLYVNFTGQLVEQGEKLALLDVRYSPELNVTLEDLLKARQTGNREREESARKRLRLSDIGDEQINAFLQTGKVNTQLTIYSPIKGHVIKKYQREGNFVDEGTPLYDVADLDRVWIEAQVYEADQALLREKQPVSATTLALPNQQFDGKVSFIFPHLDETTRTLRVRFEMPNPGHKLRPGMYATVKLSVSPRQMDVFSRTLADDWTKRSILQGLSQALATPTGPMTPAIEPLLHAAREHVAIQHGLVLALPESAVIDTGAMKIVYRESAPHVYDGVLVELGPRMTTPDEALFYPVLRGLEVGDRIVTNGSFLIDAETRLNPAAGSIYFGGSGASKGSQASVAVRPSTPEDADAKEKKIKGELAKLTSGDRRLAEAQEFCPILQGNRLGSMGSPIKVMLDGQPVFLCCAGCEDKAKANPKQTLEKVEALKKGKSIPAKLPETGASSKATSDDEAGIKANLAKLTASDRQLAEAQRLCPITGERLGEPSMGVPVKVMIKDQPVFLCCKGCEDEARQHADRTLAKATELKAKHHQHD